MQKTFKYALAAGVVAWAASTGAVAGGASAGMLSDTCFGCHGVDGQSAGPAIPTIAGLSNDYLVEVMKGYASGEIPSTIMGRIAKGYSEEEIAAIAKFYSEKKFVAAAQAFDAAEVKAGKKIHEKYCDKCHSEGGSEASDDAGLLAGQWSPYVRWTIQDFTSGARKAPKKMAKQLKKVMKKEGDKGIHALVQYYASQQ
jgi:sulfide dehydrogenase cytochrome subunit